MKSSDSSIWLIMMLFNRHLLAVPRFRLNTYGRLAFSVAGPMAWNSLSNFIRDPTSSTDCFRHVLKTTCSHITSVSSTSGAIQIHALTHSLTHSLCQLYQHTFVPYHLSEYSTDLHKKSFLIRSLYSFVKWNSFFGFVAWYCTSFWLCLLCLLFDVRLSPLINITYICTHLQSHVMTAACCWCTPRGIQYSRCDSTEELWALVGCLNISRTHAGNFSLCSSCAGNNNKQNVSEWQVITVHPIIFVMLSALNSTQLNEHNVT